MRVPARKKKKKMKLHFFNSEYGWMLRRVVRAHPVQRSTKQFCALCGINSGNPQKLRARPNSRWKTCCIHLCTVPNIQESGLSCFQAWHRNDTLRSRIYYSSQERREAFTKSESRSPSPLLAQRTPSSQPQPQPRQRAPTPTPPPSPPPQPRRTRTRRRVSISPGLFASERWRSRRRTASPGVHQHRERVAEEEREQRARESVQEQATRFVNSWKRGKGLDQLILNLAPVLPRNANVLVSGTLDTAQNIKTASRKARRSVHPDINRRYNPTPLQKLISEYAFIALQEAYDIMFPN